MGRTVRTLGFGSAGFVAAMALAWGAPAGAASFTDDFATSANGWTIGDINSATTVDSPGAVGYNAAGYIETDDVRTAIGFIAGSQFLGALRSGLGGVLSYDLSDTETDGVVYAGPVIYSSFGVITYGTTAPGTAFTHFDIGLNAAGWSIYPGGGVAGFTPVSSALFAQVLTNATNFAVNADWKTGGDHSRLDNVSVTTAVQGGVPEPASWALMILGFGAAGASLRRRRAVPA